MDSKKKILDMLIGLVTCIVIGIIIYILLKEIGNLVIDWIGKIKNIASSLDSVVIVALITGTLSIFSLMLSKFFEYKQTTRRYLYEKREKPYEDFISMMYRLQGNTNGLQEYTQKEMVKDIAEFSQSLTMWGSNKVIKKWINFREKLLDGENGAENLFLLEDIVFEIRKDMGQKNKGLKVGDILSFFVNDIKKYVLSRNLKKSK